jgi:hypothetical protein
MDVELLRGPNLADSQLSVRQHGRVVYAGALPPWARREPNVGTMPGVNIAVCWMLFHRELGAVKWDQTFLDGAESSRSLVDTRGLETLEIECPFSEMLRICYEGFPFEDYFHSDWIVENFATLSCLSGLLTLQSGLRLGLLSPEVCDALCAWADGC